MTWRMNSEWRTRVVVMQARGKAVDGRRWQGHVLKWLNGGDGQRAEGTDRQRGNAGGVGILRFAGSAVGRGGRGAAGALRRQDAVGAVDRMKRVGNCHEIGAEAGHEGAAGGDAQ